MSSRTTAMIGYLKDTGGLPGNEESKKLLADEQGKVAALQASLDMLKGEREKEKISLEEARQEMARLAAELNSSTGALVKARSDHALLVTECEELKAKVAEQKEVELRLQESTVLLHKDLQLLRADLKDARAEIATLKATVVNEHEEGFYKALRQVEVILKVEKPLTMGFDIDKDVYGGELTYVGPPVAQEEEVLVSDEEVAVREGELAAPEEEVAQE